MDIAPYHKIKTIYERDDHGHVIVGTWKRDEFGYLCDNLWRCTEKVDGTNIRIHWSGEVVSFGGRTNRAQLPASLVEALTELAPTNRLQEVFPDTSVTLFGEGYGKGIQRVGAQYIPDHQSFILFDVRIDDLWLEWVNVSDIAGKLHLPIVPEIIPPSTLAQVTELCAMGFPSKVGDLAAEGLVLRPMIDMSNRRGDRIITKLKCRDFKPVVRAS